MRFVLFVEGDTEQKSLPQFLKRWLDPRLGTALGVKPIIIGTWSAKACRLIQAGLDEPRQPDIVEGIGLLDLYGLPSSRDMRSVVEEWYRAKVEEIER